LGKEHTVGADDQLHAANRRVRAAEEELTRLIESYTNDGSVAANLIIERAEDELAGAITNYTDSLADFERINSIMPTGFYGDPVAEGWYEI
jgi:cellobiose-specific phosphotransferase system component IIA